MNRINSHPLDGDADLQEVNDVMAVASLLKMFLVWISCFLINIYFVISTS